jgi:hypothetical protein
LSEDSEKAIIGPGPVIPIWNSFRNLRMTAEEEEKVVAETE